jgi:hypothetical protein
MASERIMTRAEHLAWCKERALEYCKRGELTNAMASMASDLRKHEETAKHPGIMLGMSLMIIGDLNTSEKMRRFIDGFN